MSDTTHEGVRQGGKSILGPVSGGLALIALMASVLITVPGRAQDLSGAPALAVPIDCPVGRAGETECLIHAFVDHDLSSDVADHRCQARTYNAVQKRGRGHQGVDMGVLDWTAWTRDIPILAAADGVVGGRRDGMADARNTKGSLKDEVRQRACGNSVRIEHGNGWHTQYCHMKRGSVRVAAGEDVKRGQVIGMMGSSGMSSYPHLHFQVMTRKGGELLPVDPYSGTFNTRACGERQRPLWTDEAAKALPYAAADILKLGFTTKRPDFTDLALEDRAMSVIDISGRAPVYAFVLHSGVPRGGAVRLKVTAPDDGRVVLSGTRAVESVSLRGWAGAALTGARRFRALSDRQGRWPEGVFTLTASLVDADGNDLFSRKATVRLTRAQ
ncbi:M23 family metallopeptidase [Yunchengibacter salinarum]|uniref:M23 family metallopeptidase n=1 Tax=Yunchengibacter salinarum TaxID=3133399 RepID=UPI0035B5F06F